MKIDLSIVNSFISISLVIVLLLKRRRKHSEYSVCQKTVRYARPNSPRRISDRYRMWQLNPRVVLATTINISSCGF